MGQQIAFWQFSILMSEVLEVDIEHWDAGMYLGEVTRRILLKFAEETGLFGGPVPTLQEEDALTTPDTSKIDHDSTFFGGPTADILRSELGLGHWQTFWDRQLVSMPESNSRRPSMVIMYCMVVCILLRLLGHKSPLLQPWSARYLFLKT